MSDLAPPNQLVTVTLGWREPNGQVVEFGDAGDSTPSVSPADASSDSSSSPNAGTQDDSTPGSGIVDLLA